MTELELYKLWLVPVPFIYMVFLFISVNLLNHGIVIDLVALIIFFGGGTSLSIPFMIKYGEAFRRLE